MADFHPTIYQVHLELQATHNWQASAAYRERMLAGLEERARAAGKTSITVHGRYSYLGTFKVDG